MDDFRLDQTSTIIEHSYTVMFIDKQDNLPPEILRLVNKRQTFTRWHNCIMSLNKLLTRVNYARELVAKRDNTFHWRCIQNNF